ncbi:Solute carrier family 23 member 2, partial [Armadillidium vulgare]
INIVFSISNSYSSYCILISFFALVVVTEIIVVLVVVSEIIVVLVVVTEIIVEVSVEVVNYDDSPTEEKGKSSIRKEILYSTNEIPPWHLCILLGIQQHFFIMVGSTLPIPYFLTPLLCLQDDDPSRGQIISSIFFVSGIVTMLQTTFGCRLPIVQGGTFAFLLPTMAILTTSFDSCQTYDFANMTTADKDDIWMTRIRAIQGAIIISSITQVLIGLTERIAITIKYISNKYFCSKDYNLLRFMDSFAPDIVFTVYFRAWNSTAELERKKIAFKEI